MPDDAFPHCFLTPLVAPWVEAVLAQSASLAAAFAQHGSPLNIHHLPTFAENHAAYAEVLAQQGLDHLVLFARKANKCLAFAQEACRAGFGVDTASYRELATALAAGCPPERLVVTAAVKTQRLVELAVRHQVPIMLDNIDECDRVQQVAATLGQNAPVGIRLSGFSVRGQLLHSRFGFPVDDVPSWMAAAFTVQGAYPNLRYQGLHFHLNGYDPAARGAALLQAVACADALQERGYATAYVDIGGGLLVNYLAHRQEWEAFHEALRAAVLHQRPPLTFDNNGLGLLAVDGRIHGRVNAYPYYNELPKARFLAAVLTHEDAQGTTAAEHLRRRGLALRLEPGRSLLDQAGITLARVAFRKRDTRGRQLVGLEMNRTQLRSSNADFLLDPLYVPLAAPAGHEASEPADVYLVGAYCLEQELILQRRIRLPRLPAVGDLLCFPNTAGYMMHFFESEAHLFETAANLFVEITEAGNLHFTLDPPAPSAEALATVV